MNKINQNEYSIVLRHEISSIDIEKTEVRLFDKAVFVTTCDGNGEVFQFSNDINPIQVNKDKSYCAWSDGILTITLVLFENWTLVPMSIV